MQHWQDNVTRLYESIAIKEVSEIELKRLVSELVHFLGFEHYVYATKPVQPLHSGKIQVLGSVQAKWLDAYMHSKAYISDVVLQYGFKNTESKYWHFRATSGSDKAKQILALGHCFAQQCNNVMPPKAVLCLIGQESLSSERLLDSHWVRLYEQIRLAVHLSLSAYFLKMWRVQRWDSFEALTPREIEVLSWSADGKSAQEIGKILGISTHTVNAHIKNSASKLRSSNKTSSVLKAYIAGLLT